jgi:DNA-binding transcriptional regulator YbjK
LLRRPVKKLVLRKYYNKEADEQTLSDIVARTCVRQQQQRQQQLSAIPANGFDVCIKDNVFFIVFNFLS